MPPLRPTDQEARWSQSVRRRRLGLRKEAAASPLLSLLPIDVGQSSCCLLKRVRASGSNIGFIRQESCGSGGRVLFISWIFSESPQMEAQFVVHSVGRNHNDFTLEKWRAWNSYADSFWRVHPGRLNASARRLAWLDSSLSQGISTSGDTDRAEAEGHCQRRSMREV